MYRSAMEEQVGGAETALRLAVAGLDPDDVPAGEAVRVFEGLDRIVRTASAARTLLARRVEDSQEWKRLGYGSAAEHLAATSGKGLGAAKSDLQELREEALKAKAAADADPAATHARIRRERRLTRFTDSEGARHLSMRGPVDEMAIFEAELDRMLSQLILTKGDAVAQVTSLTRGPTQAMRYALLWSSPTCCVEGCTRTIVEHDHVWGAEYKDTRHTRLDELKRTCHTHHDLHTIHGWALLPGPGKQPMVPPEDPRHPRHALAPPGIDGSDRLITGSAPPPRDPPPPLPSSRAGLPRAAPDQPDLFSDPAA